MQYDEGNGMWQRDSRSMNPTQADRYAAAQGYSVFQWFRQAKFANGGVILSSNQFSLLPKLTRKAELDLKMVKYDSKVIVSLPKI